MNKKQFLDQLTVNLRGIPKEDRLDIISDFEEHFKIGMEKGRSEDELSESLGNPKILAKQLKANVLVDQAEKTASATNITRAVFGTLGLGFFNLIFVLGPFAGITAVLFSLFATAVAIAASGITILVATIFGPLFPEFVGIIVNPAVGIFGSIGLTCFGILFFIGDIFLGKVLYRLFIKYIKFNIRVIKGKEL